MGFKTSDRVEVNYPVMEKYYCDRCFDEQLSK